MWAGSLAVLLAWTVACADSQDFQTISNARLDTPVFQTFVGDEALCRQKCGVFRSCNALNFRQLQCMGSGNSSAAAVGLCSLLFDTPATAPNRTAVAPDSTLLVKLEAASLLAGFQPARLQTTILDARAVPDAPPLITAAGEPVFTLGACAGSCLQIPACLAFLRVAPGPGFGSGDRCSFLLEAGAQAGARFVTGPQYSGSVYYERTPNPPCAAGFASGTGHAPNCTACPAGTYSGASRTSCTACPSGSTSSGGASDVRECFPVVCPEGSAGLDANGVCHCSLSRQCAGPSCTNSSTFPGTCSACRCDPLPASPSIERVNFPNADSVLIWFSPSEVRYSANAAVQRVDIGLFRLHPFLTNTVYKVLDIAVDVPNTGAYPWTVPSVTAATDYVVVVFHRPLPGQARAPTHRNTQPFAIVFPQALACRAGFASATGREPCAACPIGTFAAAPPTACTPCPANLTTVAPGARSLAECDAHPVLSRFTKVKGFILGSSNHVGYRLEEHDHVSLEECAQRCLDVPGCKSFEAGQAGNIQDGDCFLSYDNRNTTAPELFFEVPWLDYYERREATHGLPFFEEHPGCFVFERDIGGEFAFTGPEPCSQLCLDDPCCLAFEFDAASKRCFLSHENQATAPQDYHCSPAVSISFFGRKFTTRASLPNPPPSLLGLFQGDGAAGLSAYLTQRLAAYSVVAKVAAAAATAAPRLEVGLRASTAAGLASITSAIQGGLVQFPFSDGRNASLAFAGPDQGPCEPGRVSVDGQKPCTVCRANTFASPSRTQCSPCPPGTVSNASAASADACSSPAPPPPPPPPPAPSAPAPSAPAPTSQGLIAVFGVGDEWVGQFKGGSLEADVGGTLVLQVLSRGAATARLLATAVHGQFCDAAAGCRTAGVSQYYLEARAVGQVLSATYVRGDAGWIGITDRTFQREDLLGSLAITDQQTTWVGAFGQTGSFDVTQLCRAGSDLTGFEPGEVFVGQMACAPINGRVPEGQQVFRRLELLINSVSESSSGETVLKATVDFDTATTFGQYQVTSTPFNPSAGCRDTAFEPIPGSPWLVEPDAGTPLRLLSGHFQDGNRVFSGELSVDSRCDCRESLNPVASANTSLAAACRLAGLGADGDANVSAGAGAGAGAGAACVVEAGCAGARRLPSGAYVLDVSERREACQSFFVARTCTEAQLCKQGWTRFAHRCYLPVTQPASFAQAQRVCRAHGAELASSHSEAENRLLAGLGPANSRIGLRLRDEAGGFAWADQTPLLYVNWAAGHPLSPPNPCVTLTANGSWIDGDCDLPRPYLCKNTLLAVETSCACTGEADTQGLGSSCSFWAVEDKVPWCYTSRHCPRAIPRDLSRRYWTACDASGTEAQACPDGQFPGAGGRCTAWSECPRGQFEFKPPSAAQDRVCSTIGEDGFSEVMFDAAFNSVVGTPLKQASFARDLEQALAARPELRGTATRVTLHRGSIIALVHFADKAALAAFAALIAGGAFRLEWPTGSGSLWAPRFASGVGPCGAGNASRSGLQPCTPCPANTFVGLGGAATACTPCPCGTASPPGASSELHCTAPPPTTPDPLAAGGDLSRSGAGCAKTTSNSTVTVLAVFFTLAVLCLVLLIVVLACKKSKRFGKAAVLPASRGAGETEAFDNPLFNEWRLTRERSGSVTSLSNSSVRSAWLDAGETGSLGGGDLAHASFSNPMFGRRAGSVSSLPSISSAASISRIKPVLVRPTEAALKVMPYHGEGGDLPGGEPPDYNTPAAARGGLDSMAAAAAAAEQIPAYDELSLPGSLGAPGGGGHEEEEDKEMKEARDAAEFSPP